MKSKGSAHGSGSGIAGRPSAFLPEFFTNHTEKRPAVCFAQAFGYAPGAAIRSRIPVIHAAQIAAI